MADCLTRRPPCATATAARRPFLFPLRPTGAYAAGNERETLIMCETFPKECPGLDKTEVSPEEIWEAVQVLQEGSEMDATYGDAERIARLVLEAGLRARMRERQK